MGKTYYVSGILKADFQELETQLQGSGVALIYYKEIIDLMEAAFRLPPDAILLHPKANLPDGCAIATYLSQSNIPEWRQLPVIGTMNEEDGLEQTALSAGMNGYITYPFSNPTVKLELEKVIAQQKEQPLYYDLSYAREMADNDLDFLQDLINTFVEKNMHGLDEMKALYDSKRFSELSDLAHKLKSSYALIGAHAMQVSSFLLERWCKDLDEASPTVQAVFDDLLKLNQQAGNPHL